MKKIVFGILGILLVSSVFILSASFVNRALADECTADDISGGITLSQISPNYNSGILTSITYTVQPDNGSAGTHCTNSMTAFIVPNSGSPIMIDRPDGWSENTGNVAGLIPTGNPNLTSVTLKVQFENSTTGDVLTETTSHNPIMIQNGSSGGGGGPGGSPPGSVPPGGSPPPPSGTPPPSGGGAAVALINPLSVKNIPELITLILKYLLGLIASVSIVMIVIAGFRLVVNAGNEKATTEARRMITAAITGFAVSALAYTIISIISNALTTTPK